ncbi:CLUMA_CG015362, isoform A [Clunio marinus]|uniref:CLUMA_CG015362, isoform A n=1 Tax=Clunio marinus TaxID=568069 RepID=A0A1J1IRX5_9DIPT|nr:CLUMA_CG015362, isoform A [Clunio marinus]
MSLLLILFRHTNNMRIFPHIRLLYHRQYMEDFSLGINSQDFALPTTGKDGFRVSIDLEKFSENEINVKTVNNFVVIEGKHEERHDEDGYITRRFTRRYSLPKGYDPSTITSTLSSDGVLTIKAPPPKNQLENNERVIPIQQTGPDRLNARENKKEGDDDKKSEESS